MRLRIAELRKQRGVTQPELANRVFITQGSVSAFEANAKLPGLETAYRIANVLGCKIDDLIVQEVQHEHLSDSA